VSFYDRLAAFGNKTAAIDAGNNSYSYKALDELTGTLAEVIQANRKKLILILCRNSIESLIGYLSVLRSGNVAMLVDLRLNKGLLDRLIEIYRPDFLWQPLSDCKDSLFTFRQYCLTGLNTRHQSALHRDLMLLLSTSGTTGSPKFVRLSSKNLDSNAKAISEYMRLDDSQRPVTLLPMNYSYGLSVINSHLSVGATLLLTDAPIVTRPFWDFFKKKGATSVAGVPYTFETLKRLRFFKMDLPALRVMTQAGGRLDPELALEFAEFSHKKGIDFFMMYGQTEATARITYLPPLDNLKKYKSIGIPIPGGDIRLEDVNGKIIKEPFVSGELIYSGDNVMMGYAGSREDLHKGDELKGTLRTGDIAYFDGEGYYYISGRVKRFIKIFGNRVNLDEIESFLNSEGHNCVCGGSDDLIHIVCTKCPDQSYIRKLVTKTFGFHHSVVRVSEVDQIPRNASGKVQYDEIMKRAGMTPE
jgi:acyl-CoA synthetase (AMP-forming)/AMP-acid ligase II